MARLNHFAGAFAIFAKYDHDDSVAAEHDIVYAGPDPEDMTDEDCAAVEALGWHREEEQRCWGRFT